MTMGIRANLYGRNRPLLDRTRCDAAVARRSLHYRSTSSLARSPEQSGLHGRNNTIANGVPAPKSRPGAPNVVSGPLSPRLDDRPRRAADLPQRPPTRRILYSRIRPSLTRAAPSLFRVLRPSSFSPSRLPFSLPRTFPLRVPLSPSPARPLPPAHSVSPFLVLWSRSRVHTGSTVEFRAARFNDNNIFPPFAPLASSAFFGRILSSRCALCALFLSLSLYRKVRISDERIIQRTSAVTARTPKGRRRRGRTAFAGS